MTMGSADRIGRQTRRQRQADATLVRGVLSRQTQSTRGPHRVGSSNGIIAARYGALATQPAPTLRR